MNIATKRPIDSFIDIQNSGDFLILHNLINFIELTLCCGLTQVAFQLIGKNTIQYFDPPQSQ